MVIYQEINNKLTVYKYLLSEAFNSMFFLHHLASLQKLSGK